MALRRVSSPARTTVAEASSEPTSPAWLSELPSWGESGVVITHADDDPVGLVPQQLDGREGVDLDVQHRAVARQPVAQLPRGNARKDELGEDE